jgi:hypothetical protein
MHVESVQAVRNSEFVLGVHRKQPPGIWQTKTASATDASETLASTAGGAIALQTWRSVSHTAWSNRAQSAVLWHWVASELKSTVQPAENSKDAIRKVQAAGDPGSCVACCN